MRGHSEGGACCPPCVPHGCLSCLIPPLPPHIRTSEVGLLDHQAGLLSCLTCFCVCVPSACHASRGGGVWASPPRLTTTSSRTLPRRSDGYSTIDTNTCPLTMRLHTRAQMIALWTDRVAARWGRRHDWPAALDTDIAPP